jgi:hypothetical protein
LSWGIQIYILFSVLYIYWQLFVARAWIFLIIAFFFSGYIISIWAFVLNLFLLPFQAISAIFAQKGENNSKSAIKDAEYEVVSPEGKVISKEFSWDKTNKQFAMWFLITYSIIFTDVLVRGIDGLGIAWYLIMPFILLAIASLILFSIGGVWCLIRKKTINKTISIQLLTKSFKIITVFYAISTVLALLIALS